MTQKTIAQQLEETRVLLSTATNQELADVLATTGYNEATIKSGQTLYDNAVNLVASAETAASNQLDATKKVQEMTKLVKDNYQKLSQTATTIFKNDRATIRSLSLTITHRTSTKKTVPQVSDTDPNPDPNPDPIPANTAKKSTRDRSQATFLNQARKLYDGALLNSEVLEQLSKFGYAAERLKTERKDITALEEADVAQEQAKSKARIAKAAQQTTLLELAQWVSQFKGVVTPALKHQPELLKVMGIKTRNG